MKELALAAPIQIRLAGHPYQLTLKGMVIGHYRNHLTAIETALQYPGAKIRTVNA